MHTRISVTTEKSVFADRRNSDTTRLADIDTKDHQMLGSTAVHVHTHKTFASGRARDSGATGFQELTFFVTEGGSPHTDSQKGRK